MKKYGSLLALCAFLFGTPARSSAGPDKPAARQERKVDWHLGSRVGVFIPAGTTNVRIHLEKIQGEKITINLRDSDKNVLLTYDIARRRCGMNAQLINLSELPDDRYEVEITNGFEKVLHNFKLVTKPPIQKQASRDIYEFI